MKKFIYAAVCLMLLSGCASDSGTQQETPSTGNEIVDNANDVSSKGAAPNTVSTSGMSSEVIEQIEEQSEAVGNAEKYIFDEK